MNATDTFFSIMLAHFIYQNDRLSDNKSPGCLLGFSGVMLVNLESRLSDFQFVWQGNGFVVLAAFLLSAATRQGKRISHTIDPKVMTGWQLALGGGVMVMSGGLASETLQINSIGAGAVLGYLTLISSVTFVALQSVLLKYNRVSMIAPFNVVMPVAGMVLFAVFQGEDMLGIKYLLALLLVCSGIVLVNKIKKAG